MGLFGKNINGGIMDSIRCDEENYLIWKWRPAGAQLGESSKENAIRWGSHIRVKEGSVAVFIYSDKNSLYQDYIVGPAETQVDNRNLPIISSLVGLAYNGSTPFQAEVYFINCAETIQTKFAVPYFDVFDKQLYEYSIPVAVRGSIDFNIQDYETFIKKHRMDNITVEALEKEIKDTVIETVKGIVSNAPETFDLPVVTHIERRITDIKSMALEALREKLASKYGVNLKDINISGIEIDKDSKGYKELNSVTKELTSSSKKARNKIHIKEMKSGQKINAFEKAASVLRI